VWQPCGSQLVDVVGFSEGHIRQVVEALQGFFDAQAGRQPDQVHIERLNFFDMFQPEFIQPLGGAGGSHPGMEADQQLAGDMLRQVHWTLLTRRGPLRQTPSGGD
jgi:hypothetical protein